MRYHILFTQGTKKKKPHNSPHTTGEQEEGLADQTTTPLSPFMEKRIKNRVGISPKVEKLDADDDTEAVATALKPSPIVLVKKITLDKNVIESVIIDCQGIYYLINTMVTSLKIIEPMKYWNIIYNIRIYTGNKDRQCRQRQLCHKRYYYQ